MNGHMNENVAKKRYKEENDNSAHVFLKNLQLYITQLFNTFQHIFFKSWNF